MTQKNEYKPWRLEWTSEHIKRFWDWWGSNPALTKHYFSKRNGAAVLDHVSRYVRFSGVVVDLGAGPGYIVDLLLKRGVETLAVDTSAESLAVLEQRLAGNSNFLGTKVSKIDHIPIENRQVDAVLLIETVEHLGDDVLAGLLKEAYRIIKPGGWITVTTPNDEKLEELETICPNCGCIYHSYQHLRSWSVGSLEAYMSGIGFTKVICSPTLFSSLSPLLRPLHRIAFTIARVRLPHLLYIGKT